MAQKPAKSQAILVVLPLELAARLAAHCAAWGEPAAATLTDALVLHLDELDAQAETEQLDLILGLAGFVS